MRARATPSLGAACCSRVARLPRYQGPVTEPFTPRYCTPQKYVDTSHTGSGSSRWVGARARTTATRAVDAGLGGTFAFSDDVDGRRAADAVRRLQGGRGHHAPLPADEGVGGSSSIFDLAPDPPAEGRWLSDGHQGLVDPSPPFGLDTALVTWPTRGRGCVAAAIALVVVTGQVAEC